MADESMDIDGATSAAPAGQYSIKVDPDSIKVEPENFVVPGIYLSISPSRPQC